MHRSLVAILFAAFALSGCSGSSSVTPPAAAYTATPPPTGPPQVSEVFTPLPCRQGTTIGMEGCAEHAVLRSDVVINRALRRLWHEAANAAARSHITAAQTAWQSYRKAACLSESDAYAGGTLSTVIAAQCLARITAVRAAELDKQGRQGP